MNLISIVVIGRNEETAVGRCLDEAFRAAEQIGGAEIIYVDSASTDRTVAVAQSCGARVLSLKPDWQLSPSAGRFIGSHYAGGEFILFLDADTLVYENFLPAALEHFRRCPEVGGINGRIDDLNDAGEILENAEKRFDDVRDVKWLRGPCCFYRAEALRTVGSFNPYLIAEEEAELGLRLVKNGWKLQILPIPMACHTRNFDPQNLRSIAGAFKREIRSKRFGEYAKAFAYAVREGCGTAFLWTRLKTTIIFTAWLLASCLCLLLPAYFFPKVDFAAALLIGLGAVFIKKRTFAKTVYFIFEKTLSLLSLLGGIRKISSKTGIHYPLDAIEFPALPGNQRS